MSKQRKQYTEEFKATVALEAVKGEKSLQEPAAQYGVAAGQIWEWKQQLQQGAAQLFVRKNKADKNVRKPEKKVNDLEQPVGQREYEPAWLKKRQWVYRRGGTLSNDRWKGASHKRKTPVSIAGFEQIAVLLHRETLRNSQSKG